jgi:hypothetical protein
VVLLTACAPATYEGGRRPPVETPPADEAELARTHEELRRLDAELRDAGAQATAVPDCDRVEKLRDNICALAARICQIADRQPAGSTAAERCADGKTRCKSAAERTQARGCPPKK